MSTFRFKSVLLIIAVCGLFSLNSTAQQFVEKGAVWHFTAASNYWLVPSIKTPVLATYTKDSVINSQLCQEIEFTGLRSGMMTYSKNKVYLFKKDSVVYFWEEGLKRFSVLYDFGVKKDSIWRIDFSDPYNRTRGKWFVRVDSISQYIINGKTFSSRFVTYSTDSLIISNQNRSEIIDKIGDVQSMFNWWVGVTHGVMFAGLRCYEDSVIGFHDFKIAPSCTYTNVSMEEFGKTDNIKIFPNPSNTYLNLETDFSSNFQIIDVSGRVMLKSSLRKGSNKLEVHYLRAGVYFIQIEKEGIVKSYKFVKE